MSTWPRAWSWEALAVAARDLGVSLLASMAALGLALSLDPWLQMTGFPRPSLPPRSGWAW